MFFYCKLRVRHVRPFKVYMEICGKIPRIISRCLAVSGWQTVALPVPNEYLFSSLSEQIRLRTYLLIIGSRRKIRECPIKKRKRKRSATAFGWASLSGIIIYSIFYSRSGTRNAAVEPTETIKVLLLCGNLVLFDLLTRTVI